VIALAEVRELDAAASTLALALEPDAVALSDAVAMWEMLDAVERKVSATKALLACQVEESKVWKQAGHRSAAEFMAARSGSSIGAARVQLDCRRGSRNSGRPSRRCGQVSCRPRRRRQ
jgi:hypothetical protein